MRYPTLALLALLACMLTACIDMGGNKLAVVDTNAILAESAPAKAGEAHLQQVRAVLQKGMDDVRALYAGKEQRPEAQQTLREAQAALERQFAAERQAVLRVLGALLDKAVRQWRAANSGYTAVISRQMLLDSAPAADVTPGVMQEMNLLQPVFPPLPTVTLNPPKSGDATPQGSPQTKQQEKSRGSTQPAPQGAAPAQPKR